MKYLEILEDEVLDDLQVNGLKIFQKKRGFKFGMDSILLAEFASKCCRFEIVDLGTGSGIIPLLLAGKYECENVYGLEIQLQAAEMAKKNIKFNNLSSKVKIINGDIRKVKEYFEGSKYNTVVSNPPYVEKGGGLKNEMDSKTISRHEILCGFEELAQAAKYLLKPNGSFVLVHRPYRLVDIMYIMREYAIEPKYMQFVHPNLSREPNLVLIKGVKHGKRQLNIMQPLVVYATNGQYTDEVKRIYRVNTTICDKELNLDG